MILSSFEKPRNLFEPCFDFPISSASKFSFGIKNLTTSDEFTGETIKTFHTFPIEIRESENWNKLCCVISSIVWVRQICYLNITETTLITFFTMCLFLGSLVVIISGRIKRIWLSRSMMEVDFTEISINQFHSKPFLSFAFDRMIDNSIEYDETTLVVDLINDSWPLRNYLTNWRISEVSNQSRKTFCLPTHV